MFIMKAGKKQTTTDDVKVQLDTSSAAETQRTQPSQVDRDVQNERRNLCVTR